MRYRYAVKRFVAASGGRSLTGQFVEHGHLEETKSRHEAETISSSWVTSPLRNGPRRAQVLRSRGVGAWLIVADRETETGIGAPRPHPAAQNLREAAIYAVADFRAIAAELGETENRTSPALRAANRLQAAIDEDRHWRKL